MERVVPFIVGFIVAGLIGFLASKIVARWATGDQMWKHSEQTLFGVIGLRVLAQLLLLVTLLTSICAIVYTLQNEWLLAFVVGFFFAAVIGFHLQNLRKNWKRIVSIFHYTTQTSSNNERFTTLESDIVGNTSSNDPDSSESGSISKTPISQIKIKQLEKRLADLSIEYEAANDQRSSSVSEVERVRLQRQIDNLEKEMQQVQNKLDSFK